jgi:DNA-binding CsgD family transcriptional regulator
MRYSEDQAGLLQALFTAATSAAEAPWDGFLELLCKVTQSEGAALGLDRGASPPLTFEVGPCPAFAPELRQRLRPERVYDQDSLPERPAPGFLRAVASRESTCQATLWLHRPEHRRDFRSAEAQPLHALAPFLGPAGHTFLALRQERARAALADRLNRSLGAGWLVLDLAGALLDLSQDTSALAASIGLRLPERRRPEFAGTELARGFRAAVTACTAGQPPQPALLSHAPPVEALLSRESLGGEPVILVRLRRGLQAGALPDGALARHLGLSRSEARLATLLADGHSLRTAAAALGWTEETARSCSKTLFSRLHLHGQPDLLRRILGSAVWFCDPDEPPPRDGPAKRKPRTSRSG